MKISSNSVKIIFLFGSIISGCAISNPKFFSSVEPASDTGYGYTATNPITIKNGNVGQSINSAYYFLSHLRTDKGNKLQLLLQAAVRNPNYKEPAIKLQNRYTGQPLSHSNGFLIDLYMLKPENEPDTIRLYFNPYEKGEIRVPRGLKFEH